uniref:Uncharacterized protein n=1 Tax=biofilter metagenome TaxID=1070537 RepID=A0A1A7GDQ8_9ZZZZ
MSTSSAITLVLAVIGAVLGVFNAWRNWINDQVRVRLDAVDISNHASRADMLVMFEVRNLSDFPVTITDIGLLKGRALAELRDPKIVINRRELASLPIRLEPRTSFSVTAMRSECPEGLGGIRGLYIRTACGRTQKRAKGWRRYLAQRGYEVAPATQNSPGIQ